MEESMKELIEELRCDYKHEDSEETTSLNMDDLKNDTSFLKFTNKYNKWAAKNINMSSEDQKERINNLKNTNGFTSEVQNVKSHSNSQLNSQYNSDSKSHSKSHKIELGGTMPFQALLHLLFTLSSDLPSSTRPIPYYSSIFFLV